MKQLIRDLLSEIIVRLPKGVFLDQKYFRKYQRRGMNFTPNGFYFPIPDLDDLKEDHWTTPSEMVGVDMGADRQLALLEEIAQNYLGEYHAIPDTPSADKSVYARTGTFKAIDGALLYGMVRKYKPKRYVEVGCGDSTLLAALAIRKNKKENPSGPQGRVTAIDPYPRDYLEAGISDIGEVKAIKVQDAPMSLFEELEENDILFIDSSHTVRTGGDTVFEILEVLPRLKKGVVIHVHDISFPFDYPKNWVVDDRKFWAEQYMLQAFLAFNSHFQIQWSFTNVQHARPEALASNFPEFVPGAQKAGSVWIKKIQ